jgi:hypothetical protein
MRLAGDGAPIGQLQIALRAFERLNGRFFVDREHDRVVRRRHIEPDDLGGLGRKFRVVALTPGFAPPQVDLLRAQETPNILHVNVAKPLGDQRPGPVRVAFRRRSVEHRQDAPVRLLVVSGLGPAIADFRKPRKSVLRVTNPPFRRRAGGAAERAANRPRRCAIGGHQHDPRLEARAVLRLGRPRHTLKLGPLLARQYDRRRLQKVAHATLNHDSTISDRGY